MIRRAFILFSIFCATLAAQAQDSTAYVSEKPQKKPFILKDRLWFGGGIGLSFGTVTAIQLDPIVGVYLDRPRKLSLGSGPSYTYYRDNRFAPPLELSLYGYRVFTRYRVIPQAYLHAEFLNMSTVFYNFENRLVRGWVPHLLLGAGYVQPLGARTSFYLQVLFEVLQDPHSIYYGQGPILSGGVGFGF
ncbi:MAG: hypothetical protein ABIQ75_04325 [Flavobacteriales bacterium]